MEIIQVSELAGCDTVQDT